MENIDPEVEVKDFQIIVADIDAEDLIPKYLSPSVIHEYVSAAELPDYISSWMIWAFDDTNCAFDEEEGPLMYHLLEGKEEDVYKVALRFRDDALTHDEISSGSLALIMQFALLFPEHEEYLLPVLPVISLDNVFYRDIYLALSRVTRKNLRR